MKPCPKPAKRKKRKTAATGKVKKLDNAFREKIMERDGRCVICGTTERLQWSHLITRRKWRTRWDPKNSAMMCAACHFKHHKQGPEDFVLWTIKRYGLEWYEQMVLESKIPMSPAQKKDLIDDLLEISNSIGFDFR